MADPDSLSQAGIASVTRIGDCNTPSTIAAAVYAGHRYARELDQPVREGVPFKRELAALDPEFDIG
jgi:dimethylamine/trimethylamine dehydrogenase